MISKKQFLFLLVATVLLVGCKEEDISNNNKNKQYTWRTDKKFALVKTQTVDSDSVYSDTAVILGSLESIGNDSSTTHGICWSTNIHPTSSLSVKAKALQLGAFKCTLKGLKHNTTYYYRAFAINSAGISYGEEFSFKTLPLQYGSATDISGTFSYNTLVFGTQIWMVENLRTTQYRNKTDIPTTPDSTYKINNAFYQWPVKNKADIKYGRLYTWNVVHDSDLCPAGFHLPTSDEFEKLVAFIGDSASVGSYLKSEFASDWPVNKADIAFSNGFNALPSGFRYNNTSYSKIDTIAIWWTADEYKVGSNFAVFKSLNSVNNLLNADKYMKNNGLSVRCVSNVSH